jgi:hypothetical protein
MFAERMHRVRAAMDHHRVDVLLLSVGADLPWLTGYEAMPLERLTMLVVPRDAAATLVVPRLEAPRVTEHPDEFSLHPWDETADPLALVAGLVPRPDRVAVGNQTWSQFLVGLLGHWPTAAFVSASVTGRAGGRNQPRSSSPSPVGRRRAQPRVPSLVRRTEVSATSAGACCPRATPGSTPPSPPRAQATPRAGRSRQPGR